MTSQTLPPEQNIAPAYMVFGGVLLAVFVAIVGTLLFPIITEGTPPSDLVVKVLAGLAGLNFVGFLLFVLRPPRFDKLFRDIVTALPFFKYGSPPSGETSS